MSLQCWHVFVLMWRVLCFVLVSSTYIFDALVAFHQKNEIPTIPIALICPFSLSPWFLFQGELLSYRRAPPPRLGLFWPSFTIHPSPILLSDLSSICSYRSLLVWGWRGPLMLSSSLVCHGHWSWSFEFHPSVVDKGKVPVTHDTEGLNPIKANSGMPLAPNPLLRRA